jgi:hypothetical protein
MYGALRDAEVAGAQARSRRRAAGCQAAGAVLAALQDDLNTRRRSRAVRRGPRQARPPTPPSAELAESLRAGAWLLGLLGEDRPLVREGWRREDVDAARLTRC